MSKGWGDFWNSTLSYFTLEGYCEACSRVTPEWLNWLMENTAKWLGVIVVLVLAISLFPLVMCRMIWLTPKRYRKTVLANPPKENK